MADTKIDTRATAPGGGEDGAVEREDEGRLADVAGYVASYSPAGGLTARKVAERIDRYYSRRAAPTPQETVGEWVEGLPRREPRVPEELLSPTVPVDEPPDVALAESFRCGWEAGRADLLDESPTVPEDREPGAVRALRLEAASAATALDDAGLPERAYALRFAAGMAGRAYPERSPTVPKGVAEQQHYGHHLNARHLLRKIAEGEDAALSPEEAKALLRALTAPPTQTDDHGDGR